MVKSELKSDVIEMLQSTIEICQKKIDYCIYDDGCHLDEMASNRNIKFKYIEKMNFFIDKFHIYNHVRNKCQTTYNMNNDENICHLNSVICEQNFSLMMKYRHALKHMTMWHFNFYLLCIYDKLNEIKLKSIKNKSY